MTQHNCVIGDVNVTAGLEQEINIKVESNISYEGIRPLVMAARTAIDIIAASSDAVKQGDRLDEIPAVELSIGEEVLIRPWDVWLGNNRHHRTGLVYNARKEMENNVASCMQIDTTGYHRGNDTAGVVKLKDASTVPATKEFHQINIVLEINISKQGIHAFGMATRPANDEFAAGNNTVQQGDCLGEVSAVGLPIGEEVLIRPWDVWIGNAVQH